MHMLQQPQMSITHITPRAASFIIQLIGVCAVILAGLVASGCSSTSSKSPFASVELRNVTPMQVRDATIEVFRKDGFLTKEAGKNRLIFEKQATKWNNLVYGDWSTTPLWVRVEVTLVAVSVGTWRLECQAYRVLDRGVSTEESKEIRNKTPYEKLLKEVAANLVGQPVAPK